jgi:hypothetical protein
MLVRTIEKTILHRGPWNTLQDCPALWLLNPQIQNPKIHSPKIQGPRPARRRILGERHALMDIHHRVDARSMHLPSLHRDLADS